MKRIWSMLAAVVLMVAGSAACGNGGTPGEQALNQTESKLDEVRSGILRMKLLASAAGQPEGRGVGFELTGPFAVAEHEGRLPMADLNYTRIAGDERSDTRFISTGTEAFLAFGDQAYQLDPVQVADMRARDGAAGNGGLEGLNLTEWIESPHLEPVGATGPGGDNGVDTVTGTLDPVPALNDILSLALDLGVSEDSAPRRLEGDAADRVRRAARASSIRIVTGHNDRLLRRLNMVIELAADAQDQVKEALGPLAGVRLAVELAVDEPNRAVKVDAPPNPKPASALTQR